MSNIDPNNPNRTPDREVHGASTVTPVGRPPEKKRNWLLWLLPLLGVLLVLLLLARSCDDDAERLPPNPTAVVVTPPPTAAAPVAPAPAVATERVTLPGGQAMDLQPNTLNYELQRYLGSPEPAPRRFTFDNLNFATSSAELPAEAQATVAALAQILGAYPNARVRVEGYADARGSDPANRQLGARGAETVARALIAAGVQPARVTAASGGETNPVETNATAQGQAENRRTDLVVLAK